MRDHFAVCGTNEAKLLLGVAVAASMLLSAGPLRADESSPATSPRISVQRDPETLTTRLVIEAHDGEIAWADVMAGLARAKGYDDDALNDVPRHKSFDLSRRHTRFLINLMNVFSEPNGIQFTILPPPNDGAEPKLEVTLDRRAMLASKRRFEKMLRMSVVEKHAGEEPAPDYGVSWPAADAAGQDRVIVLHGLGSTPEAHASLSADLRQAGLCVGQFAYAGNEPLEDSARLLAQELTRLKQQSPEVRLRLVGLSMGGLVARRVLEDPTLDAGNVTQLVMIAPPNHGSVLAYCGFGLQIWQFLDDAKARGVAQRFYDTVEDGLSEAADDLRPDSAFLKKLSGLERNPRVRYSVLLGTGAPLSEHAVGELREHLAEAKQRHRFIQFIGPKIDRILDDPDELTYGKGDGVVAVKRGRLEGVDDTVTLDFNHLSLGQPPQTDGEQRLREEIIKRLKAD